MDSLPPNVDLYLPVLVAEYKANWFDLLWPEKLAGQVEQETCPSRKSKRCWNPKTENINPKNNGEYGFGLGQITNTNKYNNFDDVVQKYSGMKGWKWEDRFNPTYQLRALIYMDRAAYRVFTKSGVDAENALRFAFSSYNGGQGGVIKDRKFCAQFKDCNPNVWYGNVETHSVKAKTKLNGYSISAFTINRDYVANIDKRAPKYKDRVRALIQ